MTLIKTTLLWLFLWPVLIFYYPLRWVWRKLRISQHKNIALPTDDEYWLPVVGESHYRDNFRKICGDPVEEGENIETVATLVFDDNNPHDPGNAVRVEIDGYTVGYLSRDHARTWRKTFARLKTDAITDVPARIRGGWLRDDGWADYGVTLRLDHS